jgi:hypothetical protein
VKPRTGPVSRLDRGGCAAFALPEAAAARVAVAVVGAAVAAAEARDLVAVFLVVTAAFFGVFLRETFEAATFFFETFFAEVFFTDFRTDGFFVEAFFAGAFLEEVFFFEVFFAEVFFVEVFFTETFLREVFFAEVFLLDAAFLAVVFLLEVVFLADGRAATFRAPFFLLDALAVAVDADRFVEPVFFTDFLALPVLVFFLAAAFFAGIFLASKTDSIKPAIIHMRRGSGSSVCRLRFRLQIHLDGRRPTRPLVIRHDGRVDAATDIEFG